MYRWLFLAAVWINSCSCQYIHDDPSDTTWAVQPDLTYDELITNGFEVPPIADSVTEVKPGLNYIVKLDCLGCPFDVRGTYIWDQYEQPGRPNSLLFNFTLSRNQLSLLLNGESIFPLRQRRSGLQAYQVEANASAGLLQNIINHEMLDESWKLGTRFGTYDISFDATLQSEAGPRQTHLMFDIVGMSYTHQTKRHDYILDAHDQRIIWLVLQREEYRPKMKIEDIQLLSRCDFLSKHSENLCGNIRKSLVKSKSRAWRVSFRVWEWDYYGKLGTVSHGWHFFWSNFWYCFNVAVVPVGFVVCLVLTLLGTRRLVTRLKRLSRRLWTRQRDDGEVREVDGVSGTDTPKSVQGDMATPAEVKQQV
ncbi:MAG: hypothetical protein M1820_004158 [Bogoriella megaspora]|nr:MAG: hypothetical protein M1820_004158 [Bogoriella megaspora]